MARSFNNTAKKIRTPQAAAKWVRAIQKKGKKVVFTNGCFDLLHSGHITYLEQARMQGDALILALNSDASVKRLKGPGRPLVALKDRTRVISALECVDCVTWFGENTPEKLIDLVIPRILVKGGDWPVEKILGAKTVLAHGGQVKSLNFVEGKSTTKLIQKARKKP